MTTSLTGTPRRGLAGLFSRKKAQVAVKPTARNQLDGAQIAKLFEKSAVLKVQNDPYKLHLSEIKDRNEITALRGALYSGK
ncbi:MAG: hypothetical protein ACJAVT_000917 [Yoonia sp.]|jgi:hypothetical protein